MKHFLLALLAVVCIGVSFYFYKENKDLIPVLEASQVVVEAHQEYLDDQITDMRIDQAKRMGPCCRPNHRDTIEYELSQKLVRAYEAFEEKHHELLGVIRWVKQQRPKRGLWEKLKYSIETDEAIIMADEVNDYYEAWSQLHEACKVSALRYDEDYNTSALSKEDLMASLKLYELSDITGYELTLQKERMTESIVILLDQVSRRLPPRPWVFPKVK